MSYILVCVVCLYDYFSLPLSFVSLPLSLNLFLSCSLTLSLTHAARSRALTLSVYLSLRSTRTGWRDCRKRKLQTYQFAIESKDCHFGDNGIINNSVPT